jgi:plasmid maintenance system antidote protein VapI
MKGGKQVTKGAELKKEIENAGVSIVFLADRMGCSRNRIYAIIGGADCTAKEIAMLSELLHLTRDKRDYIFLSENVN